LHHLKALAKAGITDPSKCYFIDDARANVETARRLGWGHCVHFVERGLEAVEGGRVKKIGSDRSHMEGVEVVSTLEELRNIWPEIFKASA
jgi:pyrimidine and pyridine-specific 5'-nucleotidase